MDELLRTVNWAGSPDPDGGIYYPIVSPKPGKPLLGVILSETICGVVTYYVPPRAAGETGHSLPCTCGEEPCEGRKQKRDHRWKGYLGCWSRNSGRLFLAEITKEAYLRCPQFELYKGALRGKLISLNRSGNASNSRVDCKVALHGGPPMELPPAFNVQSALSRIWFPPSPKSPIER